MTRGMMLRKVLGRVVTSVLWCLLVGLVPALVLLTALDLLLQASDGPSWLREPALVSVAGGVLVILLITGVARAGIKIKRKRGRYVAHVRRRI